MTTSAPHELKLRSPLLAVLTSRRVLLGDGRRYFIPDCRLARRLGGRCLPVAVEAARRLAAAIGTDGVLRIPELEARLAAVHALQANYAGATLEACERRGLLTPASLAAVASALIGVEVCHE